MNKSLFAVIALPILFFFPACQPDSDSDCVELRWYRDADGDGLGDPLSSMLACERPSGYVDNNDDLDDPGGSTTTMAEIFGDRIDPDNLFDYAGQTVPGYIEEDNTAGNPIGNRAATLGRVLFYDPQLSSSNTISCASCHQQQHGFGDLAPQSVGVNGLTGRHSMRLINARFAREARFFWDERANSLEEQVTMPIQDHLEMGFSGTEGDPSFADLVERLSNLDYYDELFTMAFGDAVINEERMQLALAQFVRSIQSFDSKYDEGRAAVNNNNANFPNFTASENRGKSLFMVPADFTPNGQRVGGGFGCNGCHSAPEFDIAPNSRNNGVIGVAGELGTALTDVVVTRSPSLRDMVKLNGETNGPMMHTGSFNSIAAILDHYNSIDGAGNNNLDNRLRGRANGQQLNMTDQERADLTAFLRTLSGTAVYTAEQWSDPFQH